ncbi:MAG: type II toxin-antitoxin system HicB family antitoxin [Tissierellia bacterium]|nr:type II toxin-antitoxin system HicB family antitoxin [Tissierellia bacterium]
MFVVYPAIFYKDLASNAYVVIFPDLDNGATEGEDINDAYFMAQDYIGSWLYDYFIEMKELPKASNILDLKLEDDEYSDLSKSFISLVGIDLAEYVKQADKRTVRKNISIPSYLNEMGITKGVNFSQILQDALKDEFNIN